MATSNQVKLRLNQGSVSTTEGQNTTFDLQLDQASTKDIIVNYEIIPISNTLTQSDFYNLYSYSGKTTILAGFTQGSIDLKTFQDSVQEPTESYILKISTTDSNVIIEKESSLGAIIDDDANVSQSIVFASVNDMIREEGSTLTYTIKLNKSSSQPIKVVYYLDSVNSSPTLTDSDFQNSGVPAGILEFKAGETSKTFDVQLSSDLNTETPEKFVIKLNSISANATIETPELIGTIVDSPDLKTIKSTLNVVTKNNASLKEGETFVFNLNLDQANSQDININYIIKPKTINLNNDDFVNFTQTGSILFKAGELQKSLSLLSKLDNLSESDEKFTVDFSTDSPFLTIPTQFQSIESTLQNNDTQYIQSRFLVDSASVSKNEGDSLVFSLKLDKANDQDITVKYNIKSISDTLNQFDFKNNIIPNGTITFKAGETTKLLTIPTNIDYDIETDEIFKLEFSSDSPVLSFNQSSAYGIILNDDSSKPIVSELTLSPESMTHAEGETYKYLLALDRENDHDIQVDYKINAISAGLTSADFGSANLAGSIIFKAGETEKHIEVNPIVDDIIESNEAFSLDLTSTSAYVSLKNSSGLGTIQDSSSATKAQVMITAVQSSVLEGKSLEYQLVLDKAYDKEILINYSVDAGNQSITASDFGSVLPVGSVLFKAGETSKTLSIPTIIDTAIGESDENFNLLFSSAQATILPKTMIQSTILNNASPIEMSTLNLTVNQSQQKEGDDFVFTLTLDKANTREITVDYNVIAISNNVDANDFNGKLPSGSITFLPNETKKTISISPSIDNINESTETFALQLKSNSSFLNFKTSTADATILDKASTNGISKLTLDAMSSSSLEGTPFEFKLTLDKPQSESFSVNYNVNPILGTLTASDFKDGILPSGVIEFAPQETVKTITISPAQDNLKETSELFSLDIKTDYANISLAKSSMVGSILNNTAFPNLTATVNNSSIKEGNLFVYTFQLDRPSNSDILVNYSVKPVASTLNADDFTQSNLQGTIKFKAGEIQKSLELETLLDQNKTETTEGFTLQLTSNSDVVLNTQSIQASILNNDTSPSRSRLTISSEKMYQNESDSIYYTLKLNQPNNQTIKVHYDVTPISDSLNANDFYEKVLPSGDITFLPNETEKTIRIRPESDSDVESDEAFTIGITSTSSILDFDMSMLTGIILNDDSKPVYSNLTVKANSKSIVEGQSITYDFVLSEKQDQDITINYLIKAVSSTLTASDFDLAKLPNGTITFKAGETQKSLTLNTKLDDLAEKTEDFTLQVKSDSPFISVKNSLVSANIIDANRPKLSITVDKEKQIEGSKFYYYLKLDKALTEDINIHYQVDAITGTLTVKDFVETDVLPSGDITFKAGETIKQLAISTANDNLNESDELFKLALTSESSQFDFYNTSATATILNLVPSNISKLTITPKDLTKKEGYSFSYNLALDQANTHPIDISYQLLPITSSLNDSDFLYVRMPSGTIHFNAGETTQTLNIYTLRDLIKENSEAFRIEFSSPSSFVSMVDSDVLGTIEDNNKSIIGYSKDLELKEGSIFQYTLTLDQTNDKPITVSYKLAPISDSLNAIDFENKKLPSGELTFNAGETTKTISIHTLDDLTAEYDERFAIDLTITSGNDNALLGTNKLYGTILNNDIQVSNLSVQPSTNIIYEGKTFKYQLNLDQANLNPITVSYKISTSNNPADSFAVTQDNFKASTPFDKNVTSGIVTFEAGETTKTISMATVDDQFSNYNILTSNHSANRYFDLELSAMTNNVALTTNKIQSVLLDNDAFTPIVLNSSALNTSVKTQINEITRLSSESIDEYLNDPTMNQIDFSANSEYIVYSTFDNMIIENDQSVYADIIRVDLTTLTPELVIENAIEPTISANGQKIAFTSYNNLLDNQYFQDTNGIADIFVKDMYLKSTQLISVINGKTNAFNIQGEDESYSASISKTGDFVTFFTKASNLVKNTNGEEYTLVKSLKNNELKQIQIEHTVEIDPNLNYAQTNLRTMSDEKQYFVFSSSDSNLVNNDSNNVADIFVQNLKTGAIQLVSSSSEGKIGNGDSLYPTISNDGRFVVFQSKSTNLTTNDMNGNTLDIFVKDLQTNKTAIVSSKANGIQGDNASVFAVISPDGHYIAFSSQNDLTDDAQDGGHFINVNPLWETSTELNGINLNNSLAFI